MGLIIRAVFWLALVLLLIPIDTGEQDTGTVGAVQALGAIGRAAGDVGSLCEREAEACATGLAAIATITMRAREAARMVAGSLAASSGEDPDPSHGAPLDEEARTGSIER